MRIAYLDCFSGMSGDMFLGALIDAGVSPEVLEETVAALERRSAAGDFEGQSQRDYRDQGGCAGWMARRRCRAKSSGRSRRRSCVTLTSMITMSTPIMRMVTRTPRRACPRSSHATSRASVRAT